jgi:hypothetical protein
MTDTTQELIPSPSMIVCDVVKRYVADVEGSKRPVLFVNSMFGKALVMELMQIDPSDADSEEESLSVSTIFYNDITIVVSDKMFARAGDGFYCAAFASYSNKTIKPAT